jgi:hypothetical protein
MSSHLCTGWVKFSVFFTILDGMLNMPVTEDAGIARVKLKPSGTDTMTTRQSCLSCRMAVVFIHVDA